MRILLFSTHLDIGGIPRHLLSLSGELVAKGHEVFVASSGGKWEGLFQEKGARLISVDLRTKSELSPKVWKTVGRLNRFLRENPVDVIHAHTRVTQVAAAVLSRLRGIPALTTCHGFYRPRLGRRLFPCWGEKVIAISGAVRDHLIQDFKLPEGRVRLIPNGVDLRQFRPIDDEERQNLRKKLNLPTEGKIIGSVSRLIADKGHDNLLESIALLQSHYPTASLVLIGEGNFRNHLEKLSRKLGISEKVYFRGEVSDPTPYLLSFDLFVHPAEWNEGFGLAPAEAMACGVPVVASKSRRGGLRMFITHKVSGYLLENNDPYTLREAIDELLKDPNLAEQVGRNGRRVIEEKFSSERMAKETSQLYQEIIG